MIASLHEWMKKIKSHIPNMIFFFLSLDSWFLILYLYVSGDELNSNIRG